MTRSAHGNGTPATDGPPPGSHPGAGRARGWLRLPGRTGGRASPDAPPGRDPLRPVLEVPPPPDGWEVLQERPQGEVPVHVRLLRDPAAGVLVYEVLEPTLEPFEAEVLGFLRDGLRRALTARPEEATEAEMASILVARVEELVEDHRIQIDAVSRERILYYVTRDFAGYGRIDALLRDPDIEDISCDGPGCPVFLFHRHREAVRTNVVFPAGRELDSFVLRLAQIAGKHLSVANPLLDATLPDKSRIQCTFGTEVTTRGSSFTIRRFRADPITPPLLLRYRTLSPEMMAYMWLAMEHGMSALFVGGTASGKTTSLNACSLFIPSERKIVSIEDTRELNLPHDNWVAGVTRSGSGEMMGDRMAGQVTMFDLLAAALRQRPEYLLVGEVRGAEAMTLFQAMATGHATYSTMHADSIHGCIHRLENDPINVPRVMLESLRIVALQAQVRVQGRLVRRLREVHEVKGIDPSSNQLVTSTVFRWDGSRDVFDRSPRSYILDLLADKLQTRSEDLWAEIARRAAVLQWLEAEDQLDYRQVAAVINAYHHNPQEVYAQALRPAPPKGALPGAPGTPGGPPLAPVAGAARPAHHEGGVSPEARSP